MANSFQFTKAYFIRSLFTATLVLAMALTLSCSSDDNNDNGGGGGGGGGNWLSCNDYNALLSKCSSQREADIAACNFGDNACTEAANDKHTQCIITGSCNGTSKNECKAHYDETCGDD